MEIDPQASRKNYRVLLIGFNFGGKTKLLFRLKLDLLIATVPTIGFNVETVPFGNLDLTIFDLNSGTYQLRSLWKHYLPDLDAIIYVIDSADAEKIPESKECLVNFLEENQVKDIPVLVLCNKQDLPNAATPVQIKGETELKSENLFIGCSVNTGEGINEGLGWLVGILSERNPCIDNRPLENPTNITNEYRTIMIGSGSSGKTAILNRLKSDSFLTTMPTVGYNVEKIEFKDLALTIFDLGGGTDELRSLWKNYTQGLDGIIYVIDSTDLNSLPISQGYLNFFLQNNELGDIPILVLCNMQDLCNTAPISQIKAGFQFNNESSFKACSAFSGEGLKEGLEWFGDALSKRVPANSTQ